MKNAIIISLLTVVFTIQSCEQKSESENVPEKVLTSFSDKFPDAKKVKWEMEDETEWEAEFKMNEKEYSANFKINGDWMETEFEIKNSEVPANIRSILDQNFKDYEIEKAEIAESVSGESYEFQIEVGEEEFEVVIDAQGNLTKEKATEESEEN